MRMWLYPPLRWPPKKVLSFGDWHCVVNFEFKNKLPPLICRMYIARAAKVIIAFNAKSHVRGCQGMSVPWPPPFSRLTRQPSMLSSAERKLNARSGAPDARGNVATVAV